LLYAITGSDSLTCINLLAGRRNWTQYIGRASYLYTDTSGRLYVTGNDGPLTVNRIVRRFVLAGELTVLDANKNALPDKEFYLIRVNDNVPIYTEDTLGVVETDGNGKIQLKPF